MLSRLRLPIILGSGLVVYLWLIPLLIQNPQIESLYSIRDYRQDMCKMYFDLGRFSQQRKDFDTAIKAYTTALENNPFYLECYDYLGICFELCREVDKALQTYLKAMSINAHFLGTRLAKLNPMPPHDPPLNNPIPTKQKWTGQKLNNKIIYVYSEGGLSDTILFLRFLPQLTKQDAKVLFKPQKELYTLCLSALKDTNIEIVPPKCNPDTITFDYYSSLLSIPSHLTINYNSIPYKNCYLSADKKKVDTFKQLLFHNNDFKIGIVWQGNPRRYNDKNRSLALSNFFLLTTMPGIKIYSLQKIHGLDQLKKIPPTISITNLDQNIHDFSDMAAVIENLDLVISVDTATAHLAGALGKPTWFLLPHITDWRWLSYCEGNQSCWYSSVKKFRQKKAGVWQDVFAHVVHNLINITAKR